MTPARATKLRMAQVKSVVDSNDCFEQIARAVQTDANFFLHRKPKPCQRIGHLFARLMHGIHMAIRAKTANRNRKERFCVRGHKCHYSVIFSVWFIANKKLLLYCTLSYWIVIWENKEHTTPI